MTPGGTRRSGTALRPVALATLAIAAAALALARWSHVDRVGFVVGWVAFVPWLVVLDRAPSAKAALAAGWAMSVAFTLAVFSWFAVAIHDYTGAPLWLGAVVLAVVAPLLQPQFLACAAVRHAAGRDTESIGGLLRAVAGAGAYVGTEWAWPKLLGDTVGYGFWISPLLRQAADAIGPRGLTFVLLVVNECLLAAGLCLTGAPRRRRAALLPLAGAILLPCSLALYGAVRLRQLTPAEGAPAVTVAAVQAGLGHYGAMAAELGTYGAVRTVLDAHFALSEEAQRAGAQLLVWPETIYPTTFGAPKSAEGAAFDREIGGFVAGTGLPLVFGAYDADPSGEFNAAIVLERDAAGGIGFDAYRKARLFPLTEQVPRWLDHAALRRWLPWLGTWHPSVSANVLGVSPPGAPPIRVAPLICYDAVDPRLVRDAVRAGAQLLVTISNDAWFSSGDGPLQHLVVAGFRSIETRTPQVRATTTGISAIVTATGETLARAENGARAVLVARVPLSPRPATLLLLWGDWFPPTALVIGVAALLVAHRRDAPAVLRPPTP